MDKDRGRGHNLCLQFFEKLWSFTPFHQRSGIWSVSGIRPTCQCRCPPLPGRQPPPPGPKVSLFLFITECMLGAFVWTERLLLFQNLFTKMSTKNSSITNLHFLWKMIIIYDIDKSTTATAFKDKLYTITMRLVFLVHIEFTKQRHLSICDTMISIKKT